MREVHEGICGNHSGVASIAHQILRQGYHWPTFYKDARAFAKSCDNCQRFSNTNKITTVPLKTLTSPWPIIVWAEAEPLASITARNLVEFVYQAIVCPYGVPYKLISDNGKQFDSKEMMEFCEHLGIKKGFSVVCHPQRNGQTEAVKKRRDVGMKSIPWCRGLTTPHRELPRVKPYFSHIWV